MVISTKIHVFNKSGCLAATIILLNALIKRGVLAAFSNPI